MKTLSEITPPLPAAPSASLAVLALAPLLWLGSATPLRAEGLTVQIGNHDSYGDEAIYSLFTIVGQSKEASESDQLNPDAIASIPLDYSSIENVMWQYEGPAMECVLYPPQDTPKSSIYKNFNFITPQDLKTKLYKQIVSALSSDARNAWTIRIPRVFSSFDKIVHQAVEKPEGDSPTPLRRFFMSLSRECCVMQGWDGEWNSQEADAGTRTAYFEFINGCGRELMKHAARYRDAESKRCLADGADALLRSYVRMRKDNSWRGKMVADADGLPGWDDKKTFVGDALHIMKHLKLLYDGEPPGTNEGFQDLITGRSQAWDIKDQARRAKLQNGLVKLRTLMECDGPFDANSTPPDQLNNLQLGDLELIIDAVKQLYGA